MLPARYPSASLELVDYADQAGPIGTVLGWVEHVQAGDHDPYSVFEHATSPNRRFSHLWFGKAGQVVQYQLLDRASWAQGAGNTAYWSCETEGFPGEALTGPQLDRLAAWHVWSGTTDAIALLPGQRGIGTHGMGGAAWGDHPGCPGPIRAAQRPEIIRRAQLLRGGGIVAISDDDVQRIAKATAAEMLTELAAWRPPSTGDPDSPELQMVIGRQYKAVKAIAAAVQKPALRGLRRWL